MARHEANNIDYVALGRRIREYRQKNKMTQEALAEEVDVSTTYISSIENGTSKVALPTLLHIAIALNTTVDTLLHDVTPASVSQFDLDAKTFFEDCSEAERKYLFDLLKVAKDGIRNTLNESPQK